MVQPAFLDVTPSDILMRNFLALPFFPIEYLERIWIPFYISFGAFSNVG
jgi:hypothetical protein